MYVNMCVMCGLVCVCVCGGGDSGRSVIFLRYVDRFFSSEKNPVLACVRVAGGRRRDSEEAPGSERVRLAWRVNRALSAPNFFRALVRTHIVVFPFGLRSFGG